MNNSPTIGPEHGTLFIHGGNLTPDCERTFLSLAGADATLVVIPTALPDGKLQKYIESFQTGPTRILLHTNDRQEADSDTFVEPLRRASSVWITGGRQWRLAKYQRA
jgi:cyanophycinase